MENINIISKVNNNNELEIISKCLEYNLCSNHVLKNFNNTYILDIYNNHKINYIFYILDCLIKKYFKFLEPCLLINSILWKISDGRYSSFINSNLDLNDNIYKLIDLYFRGIFNIHKRIIYKQIFKIYSLIYLKLGFRYWKLNELK